jgi:predicted amidohydrolase
MARADVVCFPECFVPGYRSPRKRVDDIDAAFLDDAWLAISAAAARANTAVVLGTERFVDSSIRISAIVMNRDGSIAGFQDKVQLDPSEEGIWTPGTSRRVFDVGGVTVGISICHEAWRYPKTVRYAARRGARIVFVPHFHEADRESYRPTTFADPANTFHEKAILCRAAENTCFVAAVNYASGGSPTTSAVAAPDGTLLAWQPYGQSGLLVADCDLAEATGLLARRFKPIGDEGV